MKGPKGYGFSVSAYSPVHITEVVKGRVLLSRVSCCLDPLPASSLPDLPAANADIRVGDVLLELQGNSIKNASGSDVVSMIQ